MKVYGKHRFPGRLFIVEGIDGSGKSTQLALLEKWLESEGYGTFDTSTPPLLATWREASITGGSGTYIDSR